jgi:site-specific DNA-cytosine methylase
MTRGMCTRPLNAVGYLIGAGSMSLGIESANVNLVNIWETPGYSKNARSWDLNRPANPHKVLDLNWADNHFSCYADKGIDLIYGNPPCGGVSAWTQSRVENETNNCMRHWMRMVVKGQPKAILMENGYQLDIDKLWPLLGDLTGVLEEAGYTWGTWRFFNYQVGTPQIRRRMFLYAAQKHRVINEARFTRTRYTELPNAQDRTQCPTKSVLDDLNGINPQPVHTALSNSGKVVTQHWYEGPLVVEKNKLLAQHIDFIRANTRWLTTADYERFVFAAANGDKSAGRVLEKYPLWEDCPPQFSHYLSMRPMPVPWDEAGPAVCSGWVLYHPHHDRFLTMRELALLMGYPMEWQFHKLSPAFIAQGVSASSSRWAVNNLRSMVAFDD